MMCEKKNYEVSMTLTVRLSYTVNAKDEDDAVREAQNCADWEYFTTFDEDQYSDIKVTEIE